MQSKLVSSLKSTQHLSLDVDNFQGQGEGGTGSKDPDFSPDN